MQPQIYFISDNDLKLSSTEKFPKQQHTYQMKILFFQLWDNNERQPNLNPETFVSQL